jgi:hypothetical protein
MKKLIITILATAALAACGGSGGDDSKPLFSLWKADGGAETYDLSGGSFNTPFNINLFAPRTGAQCVCTLTAIGDNTSGQTVLNACSFVQGTAPGGDPGCANNNGSYTYSISGTVLTQTSPRGVVTVFR